MTSRFIKMMSAGALAVLSGPALADGHADMPAPAPAAPAAAPAQLSLFNGEPMTDGVFYMPFGVHTFDGGEINMHLLGYSRGHLVVGTFNNSFDDQTVFVARGTNIVSYGNFGTDIIYGLMYGYDGNLADSDNLPDALDPLFEGQINPLVAFTGYYKISDTVELRTVANTLFVSAGVKIDVK